VPTLVVVPAHDPPAQRAVAETVARRIPGARALTLANEAGQIDAHGTWQNVAARSRTRLDVAVDVKEAGAFLGRFGWPGAVKGAPTKIEGQLAWAGGPGEFDYPSLTGKFVLHAGAGQFTKLNPGVGRLLGVLSLQALAGYIFIAAPRGAVPLRAGAVTPAGLPGRVSAGFQQIF